MLEVSPDGSSFTRHSNRPVESRMRRSCGPLSPPSVTINTRTGAAPASKATDISASARPIIALLQVEEPLHLRLVQIFPRHDDRIQIETLGRCLALQFLHERLDRLVTHALRILNDHGIDRSALEILDHAFTGVESYQGDFIA